MVANIKKLTKTLYLSWIGRTMKQTFWKNGCFASDVNRIKLNWTNCLIKRLIKLTLIAEKLEAKKLTSW